MVSLGEGAAELHGVAVSFLNKCFMMFMMYDSHFQKLYKSNDLQIMFQIGDLTVSEQIVPCQDCKLVFKLFLFIDSLCETIIITIIL